MFFCVCTLPPLPALAFCLSVFVRDLTKVIYNQAHLKSYHLVIARMRSIRGNP
ncbi:hypothetical protein [Helicobacter rodentium]|uniref:hypothetical protein n=1 Tax=Helicobacter rodentium TaxID=59617 RepID=UPI000B0CC99F|nr:hypothetical protein [Helicobacter rodentium]